MSEVTREQIAQLKDAMLSTMSCGIDCTCRDCGDFDVLCRDCLPALIAAWENEQAHQDVAKQPDWPDLTVDEGGPPCLTTT